MLLWIWGAIENFHILSVLKSFQQPAPVGCAGTSGFFSSAEIWNAMFPHGARCTNCSSQVGERNFSQCQAHCYALDFATRRLLGLVDLKIFRPHRREWLAICICWAFSANSNFEIRKKTCGTLFRVARAGPRVLQKSPPSDPNLSVCRWGVVQIEVCTFAPWGRGRKFL